MDFLTMMQTRKSCRAYQKKDVSREDLLKIVEAGRLSPSGCNAQPWKFIIVDEADALEKVRDALVVEDGMTGAPWRDQVPAFIILCELLGSWIENGEHPNDMEFVGGLVQDICFRNARRYFNL